MQDRWQPKPRPEDLHMTPVPVFRVHDRFEEQDEEGVMSLFHRNGYTLVTGGRHNRNNPLELSVEKPGSYVIPGPWEKGKLAAEASGISLPASFFLEDVLRSNSPFVAKDRYINGGTRKLLLETPEQKITFAAWMLHVQRFNPAIERQVSDSETVRRLKSEVDSNRFYLNQGANPPWNNGWDFEEFVETSGAYYTSFRIVVDGYGQIHYGMVAKSTQRKDEDKKIHTKPRIPIPGLDMLDPLNSIMLLTDPTSPFFLNSRNIVSNILSGGERIVLDGRTIINEVDRELITDLGIDPDNPEIPEELLDASRRIGIALRVGIPFMGVDFMRRTDGRFVLLEVNANPRLFHGALGEPKDTPQDQLYLRMYEQIIEKAKANNPGAFGIAA